MLRTAFVSVVTLHASLALAGNGHTVRDVPARPAVKITAATDHAEGCGINEIPSTLNAASSESMTGYNEKTLTAASKGLHDPEKLGAKVKAVWGWCVKPDMQVRVWAACTGAGDSSACALYASPIDARGKLGKVVRATLGWSTPKVEDVDSGNAPTLWTGRGLKVSMEAGRGNGWFGVYVRSGAIKFTKTEWE